MISTHGCYIVLLPLKIYVKELRYLNQNQNDNVIMCSTVPQQVANLSFNYFKETKLSPSVKLAAWISFK